VVAAPPRWVRVMDDARWWTGTPPVCDLQDAIDAVVAPGMHLHFASTPSRSNAAVIGVAARFRRESPELVLSSTGFHSAAHVLGRLRLGRRYIASFFGDNYPTPRPNRLYSALRAEGAALEVWSLGSLVAALRAGALGLPGALTRSLVGSTLGEDLAAAGQLTWTDGGRAALLAPMRPDVAFLHGLAADRAGNVLFAGPHCEGYWGALGAREGAIVTVERIVDGDLCARFPEAIMVPKHRIRAICETPGGARPQPLPGMPVAGLDGNPDDWGAYHVWRRLCTDDALWEDFQAEVFSRRTPHTAALSFVARHEPSAPVVRPAPPRPPHTPPVVRLALAARWIAQRVRAEGYPVILAGIGQSFLASRMAALQLAQEGREVAIMVETGLYGLPPAGSHPFLLSQHNLHAAHRLSQVEDVLMTLTCGADSRCLGVVGAGQLDPRGNINSTLIGGTRFLVGSGGANDIASSAAEVIALSPMRPERLVGEVDHITSPGHRLRSVVTERGVLTRSDTGSARWTLTHAYPVLPSWSAAEAFSGAQACCRWEQLYSDGSLAAPVSDAEWARISALDPDGAHWNTKEQVWSSPSALPALAGISRRAG